MSKLRSARPETELAGELGGREEGLRASTVRGGAVTVAAQAVKFGLQTSSTMVLGRLLVPGDFGLVALVTSVTGFLSVLRDAGLSAATVQRVELTHGQVSALFWVNVGLGVFFAVLAAVVAPVLGWFYNEPKLVGIGWALAVTFVVSALSTQHHALLRRQMRFRSLATVEIISLVVGLAVGWGMAWRGYGYWSLVGMSIVSPVASLVAVWTIQRWRPSCPAFGAEVRSMLRFGGYLTGNNLLNYLFRNVDNLLVGWRWGPEALGYYAKAYGLLMLPIAQVNGPLGGVAIAAISRVQTDPVRTRRYFLGGYAVVASVTLPVVFASALFAEEIILLLLGPQWTASVELFRWLAPAALIGALSNPLGWLLWATGRSDRLVKIGLFWSGTILLGFVAGLPFGARGVAIGFSVASILVAWPHCAYIIRGTPIRIRDILGAAQHSWWAAIGAGCVGAAVKFGTGNGPTLGLSTVVAGASFALVYGFLLLVVMRRADFFRQLWNDLVVLRRGKQP